MEAALQREEAEWNALEALVASVHGASNTARQILAACSRLGDAREKLGMREQACGAAGEALRTQLGASADGPDFDPVEVAERLVAPADSDDPIAE